MLQENETGPQGAAQVGARDPEAHRKLDAILSWIQGDQMRGVKGLAVEHREHAEKLAEHHERLERHSKRLYALEQRTSEGIKWTLRTVAERGIGAVVAGVVGYLAALFASKPHP